MANYHGSEAYKCTMNATPEQLQRRKRYTLMAIEYWKGKPEQAFFMAELELIEKRTK